MNFHGLKDRRLCTVRCMPVYALHRRLASVLQCSTLNRNVKMSSGVEEPQFQLGMVSELEADSDMLSIGEVRVEIPDFGGHVMFLF